MFKNKDYKDYLEMFYASLGSDHPRWNNVSWLCYRYGEGDITKETLIEQVGRTLQHG